MAASKTYLEDPVFDDQVAPRSCVGTFYVFKDDLDPTTTDPSLHRYHLVVEKLRENLDEVIKRYPRFGAALEEQPDGRIRLVAGSGSQDVLHGSFHDLTVDELLPILDRPAAVQNLGLPSPESLFRIDVMTLKDGICIVFRAHHSTADGRALATFAQCVTEGKPVPEIRTEPEWYNSSPFVSEIRHALEGTYFRLSDKSGPAQPALVHRKFQTPTESKTYEVSRNKCKKQIDELSGFYAGCSVFHFIAAKCAAHALTARLEAGSVEDRCHGGAAIWIPVDVRDIDGRGVDIVGNAVVPAVVRIEGVDGLFRASFGNAEEAGKATEWLTMHISNTIRLVKTRAYLRERESFIKDVTSADVRDLGARYDLASSNWVHVNDARHFGADHVLPYLGKADVVRRHVPVSPGIQLHPLRRGDDTLVLTITLPQKAMKILQERPEFNRFMEDVKATSGT